MLSPDCRTDAPHARSSLRHCQHGIKRRDQLTQHALSHDGARVEFPLDWMCRSPSVQVHPQLQADSVPVGLRQQGARPDDITQHTSASGSSSAPSKLMQRKAVNRESVTMGGGRSITGRLSISCIDQSQ